MQTRSSHTAPMYPEQKRRARKRLIACRLGLLTGTCLLFFSLGWLVSRCSMPSALDILPVVSYPPRPAKTALPAETVSPSTDPFLALVNAENPIDETYSCRLHPLANGLSVDERIYPDLQQMMDDARAQGLQPLICSAYRSHEKQRQLYDNKLQRLLDEGHSPEEAPIEARLWVSYPGTSEHQLGLAVDIVSVYNQNLDDSQEDTPEQKWLMANCWKYGFVLRYPTDKSHLTGIGYEPWHYRYVGKDHARRMTEENLCLEEYLAPQ